LASLDALAAIFVPSNRHHPNRRQPGSGAQPEHAREHLAQRPLVPAAELGDRRVIGARLPVTTRKAMSSMQARSIPREERLPRA
jgi:hypothetical protein